MRRYCLLLIAILWQLTYGQGFYSLSTASRSNLNKPQSNVTHVAGIIRTSAPGDSVAPDTSTKKTVAQNNMELIRKSLRSQEGLFKEYSFNYTMDMDKLPSITTSIAQYKFSIYSDTKSAVNSQKMKSTDNTLVDPGGWFIPFYIITHLKADIDSMGKSLINSLNDINGGTITFRTSQMWDGEIGGSNMYAIGGMLDLRANAKKITDTDTKINLTPSAYGAVTIMYSGLGFMKDDAKSESCAGIYTACANFYGAMFLDSKINKAAFNGNAKVDYGLDLIFKFVLADDDNIKKNLYFKFSKSFSRVIFKEYSLTTSLGIN